MLALETRLASETPLFVKWLKVNCPKRSFRLLDYRFSFAYLLGCSSQENSSWKIGLMSDFSLLLSFFRTLPRELFLNNT
jgi:hypothetical protein